QVQGRVLAADQVAGDREQADRAGVVAAGPEEADVGPARAERSLDRVAHQRAFTDRPLAAVEQHVGGGVGLGAEVGLDDVAADLQIADLAADDLDAALLAVADVAADDVGLVQVHAVEEDADPAVVVDVAVGEEYVAGAVGQVDAVPAAADQHAR